VARIYFDITDIIYHASRYSRLTGIQRVQLCITGLLARRYGGEIIRCAFFDSASGGMVEFDPSRRPSDSEFDAEALLIELGLLHPTAVFPSKVQVKSYLRRFNYSKVLRTLKKIDVYLSAIFFRPRLKRLGLSTGQTSSAIPGSIPISKLNSLPAGSCYACMGSVWLHPKVVEFARQHHTEGGDVVQMVYDLIPISHAANYAKQESIDYAAWLNGAFAYTTRFISISQWTADALRRFALQAGHSPEIKVVTLAHEFLGFDRSAKSAMPAQLSSLASRPFVLCVGTIEHRKNGIALLKAWQKLIEELGEQAPQLVFAGKYGKGGVEFQEHLAQHPALASYVHVIHSPSDSDLAWLYQACLFTTLPSLIEGWGLPVGESAWFGKFCVSSNATSVPEVCGELMDYVDPHDVESIKAGIRKPIVDAAYLRQRETQIVAAPLKRWIDVAEDIYASMLIGRKTPIDESTGAAK
jgi:glycosyltransferase involved in cell wall biosynthesis